MSGLIRNLRRHGWTSDEICESVANEYLDGDGDDADDDIVEVVGTAACKAKLEPKEEEEE